MVREEESSDSGERREEAHEPRESTNDGKVRTRPTRTRTTNAPLDDERPGSSLSREPVVEAGAEKAARMWGFALSWATRRSLRDEGMGQQTFDRT